MMTMHDPHGIDATNDADAFRSLQGLAQGVKGLAGMLPLPKAPDGSKEGNRAHMWTILKDNSDRTGSPSNRTVARVAGCWTCNELTRLRGEGRATRDEPARIFSLTKFVRCGNVRMLLALGAHLKPRRAWTRDTSNGQPANNIIQRIPAIILDTRLNDTQNKGTYVCDECEKVFHGPFQGELTQEARHLSYEELHPVSITRFPLSRFSPGAGLLRNPCFHR